MSRQVEVKVMRRSDREFERVVFAEVLVPMTMNVFGEISTKEMVRDFAYEFARQGYGLDIDHDEVDVTGTKYYVVESFIAREDDPDFIPGSWVVGIKVVDDEVWEGILAGTLNGFSFQADVFYTDIEYDDPGIRTVIGVTEPDPFDGHTHTYTVVIDSNNRVISGGTGVTDGHYHPIQIHTVTGVGREHRHRYQLVEGETL